MEALLFNLISCRLFLSNILIKFAVTFVSIPGIYLIKEQPKESLSQTPR